MDAALCTGVGHHSKEGLTVSRHVGGTAACLGEGGVGQQGVHPKSKDGVRVGDAGFKMVQGHRVNRHRRGKNNGKCDMPPPEVLCWNRSGCTRDGRSAQEIQVLKMGVARKGVEQRGGRQEGDKSE